MAGIVRPASMTKKSMTTKTIASAWDTFSLLIHPEASKIQRQEMRMAFYGGCFSLIKMQRQAMIENISEDDYISLIQSWIDECMKMSESLSKNRNPEA